MTTYRLDVANKPVGVHDTAMEAVAAGQSLCRPGWLYYNVDVVAKLEGGRHNTGVFVGQHEDGASHVMVWRLDR